MASKVLLLLGLFAFLLVVSEVAAGMVKSETEETVNPDQYHGGGGNGGHGGGGNYGNGGGSYGNGGGNYGNGGGNYGNGGGNYGGGGRYGGGGGGRYCRHGCCYRGYHGCSRCCSYAGEAVQTQPGH